MKLIIGLIGAKGSGKTTAYESMAEVTSVEEVTLAAKLKDVCSEVFEIPRDHFDSHNHKESLLDPPISLYPEQIHACYKAFGISYLEGNNGHITDHSRFHVGKILTSPRQIAQYIGTEVLRSIESDVHCVNAVKGKTGNIGVVTDLRFPNEFDYFRDNYPLFKSVYIKNSGAEVSASGDTHASEVHLKTLAARADITLVNEGPIQNFQASVKNFLLGLDNV